MKRILTGFGATAFAAMTLFAQNELTHGNGNAQASNGGNGLPIVVHRLHGAPPQAAAGASGTTGNGINYNGGPVMVNGVNMYYIWYGNWAQDPNANGILTNFANNIGGSPYFNINTTYFDASNVNVQNSVTLAGSVTSTYIAQNPTNLSDSDIWNIVKWAFGHDGLQPDVNGVYFVLTAPGVGESSGFLTQYCGWHTAATYNNVWMKYSFVGDANGVYGCTGPLGNNTTPNGDVGADSMASVIAHELEEATTDPLLNAWYDSAGYENADKCAWNFGTTQTAPNGSLYNMTLGTMEYRIQQNWLNANGGSCALSYTAAPDYSIAFTTSSSVTVPQGNTATYGLKINTVNGFNSAVSLSVTGLPANATASFSPNPTSATSTLSVVTTASTPAGTYTLTITGSGGTGPLVRKTTATITVTAVVVGDYSLSVTNASSIQQGQTTDSYTVKVNPLSGFTGAVNLAISGLPSGATVGTAPSPNPTTTNSTFKIATTGAIKVGTYNFTITGTYPGLTNHTVTGTLTVTTAGTMTVTINPTTLTVTHGKSGTYTVSVNGTGGFNSSTSLSVSGLPSKVNGSFSPSTVATGNGSSTLTISTNRQAAKGTYTITVTATGGGLTPSTTATLIIN